MRVNGDGSAAVQFITFNVRYMYLGRKIFACFIQITARQAASHTVLVGLL